MKAICFYFEVHHPEQLRQYHFFDIGKQHDYFDYYRNRTEIEQLARECYLPANALLLELIERYRGRFKVAFSLSGSAIELLELHAPEVIHSFQALARTGQVEFLCEPYAHSLSSLSADTNEFERDVKRHIQRIEALFGQTPVTFRNTSLIYSDSIGERIARLGFHTILTEGAKHILGWRNPNFVHHHPNDEKVKILLKNAKLSDDISLRFSSKDWNEYPLTAEKYAHWLKDSLRDSDVVNLFMHYQALGKYNTPDSGIFDFLRYLPQYVLDDPQYAFMTPKEVVATFVPKEAIYVPNPISWTDEERDITSWLGNELQQNAFEELFALSGKVEATGDEAIERTYSRLQCSNHFNYMSTKFIPVEQRLKKVSPYPSPYDAYINYMNVLSDFTLEVDKALSKEVKTTLSYKEF
ncbi:MAG: alpha-amylase [Capnocytophaga sp.]|jgi:glycosyl hydrolase, family 57|uniref:glycoside hydrolase family 57 protein n=1 Tax=Capnocytophaga sp. oral taxon 863 TaxID=1227265 RepID=UPI000397A152|nr:glycoside hydrolase family 57 protein [Capnocytophaga sp. oral taxon 863]ERI62794.1 glycosyl hydrolase, family 57 [Capnocytophaga sp. oral taxon 863 str. F0517]RKW10888.1 MAG: alpha-amylase [Capnocytophaga sp.]